MKLSHWPQVEVLIAARNYLLAQRDCALIEVVIGGCHQSAEFVEHVGPAIRLELRYQIEDLERRLNDVGRRDRLMPLQPPRFAFVKRAPRTAWQQPGKNVHRRKRGRAGQRDRAQILAEEPLCRPCLAADRVTPSEEVDHIRDDLPDELWDERENKQGICKPCHKLKTAAEAAAGGRTSYGTR